MRRRTLCPPSNGCEFIRSQPFDAGNKSEHLSARVIQVCLIGDAAAAFSRVRFTGSSVIFRHCMTSITRPTQAETTCHARHDLARTYSSDPRELGVKPSK